MNRNILKQKFDLITLQVNKTDMPLWGLVKNVRDKRQQEAFDFDYINKLKQQAQSQDVKLANEAKEALLFLNAANFAIFDGNLKQLSDLGIAVNPKTKKAIYNSCNAAKRDLLSNARDSSLELTDLIPANTTSTLGELLDGMRTAKTNLRKAGLPVSSLYKKPEVKVKKELLPQPVKQFTKNEIAQLNQQQKGNK